MQKKEKRNLCECRAILSTPYGSSGHNCTCTIKGKTVNLSHLILIKVGH